MLLNVPYSSDISVIQSELSRTLTEYLNIGFDPYLDITHEYDKCRVHMDNIVYLEKCQRVTEIHMTDGKIYRSYIPIYRFEEMLPKSMFHRISSSAIVNWRFLVSTRAYRATIRCNGKLVELGMWSKDYKWVKAEVIRRNIGSNN